MAEKRNRCIKDVMDSVEWITLYQWLTNGGSLREYTLAWNGNRCLSDIAQVYHPDTGSWNGYNYESGEVCAFASDARHYRIRLVDGDLPKVSTDPGDWDVKEPHEPTIEERLSTLERLVYRQAAHLEGSVTTAPSDWVTRQFCPNCRSLLINL
jgi:hypothetical protein